MATAPPMPGGASSVLDGPPPSPQAMGAAPSGAPTPFSLDAVAPPIPSAQMPPEILTGILQSAETVAALMDTWAQTVPDLAADFAALKDQMQTVLAKLVTAGAGATSPTASGSQFPGGGLDRGLAGAGAI